MIKLSHKTRKEIEMKKRFFIYIIIAHLLVPIFLILPIHRLRVGIGESISFISIFEYIENANNHLITAMLIVFIVIEFLGIANAIYGIKTDGNHLSTRNSFALGFSSAILGAMFLSFGSYIFFLVCAISFLVISYFSIRLMKMEK